jgi:hypothetical protein
MMNMNISVAPELREIMRQFDAEVDWSRVATVAFAAEVANRLREEYEHKLAIVQRLAITSDNVVILNPDNEATSEHNMFGPRMGK